MVLCQGNEAASFRHTPPYFPLLSRKVSVRVAADNGHFSFVRYRCRGGHTSGHALPVGRSLIMFHKIPTENSAHPSRQKSAPILDLLP